MSSRDYIGADTFACVQRLFPSRSVTQPSSDSPPECLYGELYTADAMIAEQKKLESQCSEPDDIEPVIAAIMLYSDSTHLANFGTASLWPMYAFIGNQSKYIRAKPTSFAAHHLAYISKVRLFNHIACAFTVTECDAVTRYHSRILPGSL